MPFSGELIEQDGCFVSVRSPLFSPRLASIWPAMATTTYWRWHVPIGLLLRQEVRDVDRELQPQNELGWRSIAAADRCGGASISALRGCLAKAML